MKNKFFNTIVKITLISMVLAMSMFQFSVLPANAAALTSMSDTMSRLKVSVDANHTIKFVTPSGVDAGETITITFDSGFALTSVDYTDMDLAEGNSNNCATATFTDKTLAATPSGTTWGASVSGQVVTFTSGTDTITADRCVLVEIGTNATYGETGDQAINNPSSTGSKTISFGGTFGDSGSLAVGIVSDDQVIITATIDPTFTFTISSNTCALGTLTTGSVSTCSYTLAVGTNADNGAKITIQAISDGTNAYLNKDGAPGTYIDDIAENNTVTAGTEGYGIAVTGGAGWTEEGDFNDDDTPIPSSVTDILSTTGPIESTDTSTITHRAAISTTTESGTYSQTVQYIATGTF